MQVGQPDKNVKLPEKLQSSIDDGRNKVSLLEIDNIRLSKLRNSIRMNISNLEAYRKEQEEKKETLDKDILSRESNVSLLQLSIDDLTGKRDKSKEEYLKSVKENNTEKENIIEIRKELVKDEEALKEKSINIKIAEEAAIKSKKIYDDKVTKLSTMLFYLLQLP